MPEYLLFISDVQTKIVYSELCKVQEVWFCVLYEY